MKTMHKFKSKRKSVCDSARTDKLRLNQSHDKVSVIVRCALLLIIVMRMMQHHLIYRTQWMLIGRFKTELNQCQKNPFRLTSECGQIVITMLQFNRLKGMNRYTIFSFNLKRKRLCGQCNEIFILAINWFQHRFFISFPMNESKTIGN